MRDIIYDVIEYKDRKLKRFDASEEDVRKLRCNKYDFVKDDEYDEIVVIAKDGERVALYGNIPKLGDARWYLLGTLLSRPGHPFTNYEIGKFNEKYLDGLKGEARQKRRNFIDSLYIRQNLISGIHLLRKELFKDNAREPYFIVTKRPFKASWHIERSFLLITRKLKGELL